MWDASKSLNEMHPLVGLKSSIAAHISGQTTKVPDSIPNNTFKGGAYPHSYTTLSYNDFPEPDTQPIQQNLSPLEFASQSRMAHFLPTKFAENMGQQRANTWAEGLDVAVTGERKLSTSDGREIIWTPYQSVHKTSTNVPIVRNAQMSSRSDAMILAGASGNSLRHLNSKQFSKATSPSGQDWTSQTQKNLMSQQGRNQEDTQQRENKRSKLS